MSAGVWVPLLVVGIVAPLIAVWVPLLRWLRRRHAGRTAALAAELAASGERVLRGPEPGNYRGASAEGYSRVKGNCVIAATDRRIVYRMLVGAGGEIPLERIVDVGERKAFLGSLVGGQVHLVLTLADGGEVGFFVRDVPAWRELLAARSRRDLGR